MAYTGGSIVDYLKSVGKPSDYSSRAQLAKQSGITNYAGTAQQNTQLLGMLRAPSVSPVVPPKEAQKTYQGATPPVPGTPASLVPAAPSAPFQRDYKREQEANKKYGQPKTSRELAQFSKFVYTPDEIGRMSEADKRSLGLLETSQTPSLYSPEVLRAQGFSEEQIKALEAQGLQANQAQQGLLGTRRPTNTALGVLQEALNAKSNVTNQPLGTSRLFEKAGLPTSGVGGYAVLAQGLAERSREMNDRYNSFQTRVSDVAGAMKDTFNLALDRYNVTKQAYDEQMGRLMKINESAQEHERALSLLEKQHELQRETEEFKQQLDFKYPKAIKPEQLSFENILKAEELGKRFIKDSSVPGGYALKDIEEIEDADVELSPADAYIGSIGTGKLRQDFDTPVGYMKDRKVHGGWDIPGALGDNVIAPVSGRVTNVTEGDPGWGNFVLIEDENGNTWKMAHFENVLVNGNDRVERGQVIGGMGNSGYVLTVDGGISRKPTKEELASGRGVHIHMEVKNSQGELVNPRTLFEAGWEPLPKDKTTRDLQRQAEAFIFDLGGSKDERAQIAKSLVKMVKEGKAKDLPDAKMQLNLISDSDRALQKAMGEEVKPLRENYNEIASRLSVVPKLVQEGSPIGDVAMIVNFLKVIDPRSVARETEVRTVEAATSLIGRAQQAFNKMATGEKLTSGQRKDIQKISEIISRASAEDYLGKLLIRQEELQSKGVPMTFASQSEIKDLTKQLGANRVTQLKEELGIGGKKQSYMDLLSNAPSSSQNNSLADRY